MLFLSQKPTHLLLDQQHHLILTTNHQIIFTTLHFIEEYLTAQLVQQNPTHLAFSTSKSQALVITPSTLLVYWTDWQRKLQLHLAVWLNHERIYSYEWETRWIVHGEFKQYSPKKLSLHNIQSYDPDRPNCFLGALQYILTNKRLILYNHNLKKRINLEWPNSQQWLHKLPQGRNEMRALQIQSGLVALSIDNLCLVVKGEQVVYCLHHEGKLVVNVEIAVWLTFNRMRIFQFQGGEMIGIGDIQTFQGQYYASHIFENKLCMFFYDFKELHMKTLRLVDQKENQEFDKIKKYKQQLKKNLEECENIEHKEQTESNKSFEQNLFPVFYEKQHPQKGPESPTINLLGSDMKLALKASIQKFQEELHRSFEEQKFNDEIEPNVVAQNLYCRETEAQHENMVKAGESQVQEVAYERQGLEQGSSGFEWQHLDQQNEQNLESPDQVNQLNCQASSSSHVQPAQTPAFKTFQQKYIQGNDHWDHFQNHWTAHANQLNCKQVESQQKQNTEVKIDTISKSQNINQSLKLVNLQSKESFKEETLNKSSFGTECTKKYTQILSQIYRKTPDDFEQALDSMVENVIHQNEARIFFAEHIRIFNPDLTKDRLLRLYRHVQDSQQNRKLMGRALSEFRLNEVPRICLPVSNEILNIFNMIYPVVYIQDLLQPSVKLYEQFLESYFAKQFKDEVITIEDQSIELGHPRNLLNILLYLNETFQIPLQQVFDIYARKIIKYHHSSVLKRIKETKVLEICMVDPKILESAAESAARQLLEESTTNFIFVEQLLPILSDKACKLIGQILNLIQYLNMCNLNYSVAQIFNMPEHKTGNRFCSQLIEDNSSFALARLHLSTLFKSVSKIQQGKSVNYYTREHVQITKLLAKALMKDQFYQEAFNILVPVSKAIKRGFIASLLIRHVQGKFANRLIGCMTLQPQEMQITFRQILAYTIQKLKGDKQPQKVTAKQNIITWHQFKKYCSSCVSNVSWQLCYILYCDIKLSRELVEQSIITNEQFVSCYKKLGLPSHQIHNLNNCDTINVQQLYIPLILASEKSNDTVEINPSMLKVKSKRQLSVRRSLNAFDSKNEENNILCHSLLAAEDQTDPFLVPLRLQCERQQILKMLQQIYEDSPRYQFLRAVNVIDKERIGLQGIQTYKNVVQKDIQYPIERLVPFSYFLGVEKAWTTAQTIIRTQLTVDNFWHLFLLVDILYERGSSVVAILIQKLIFYERDDRWSSAISDILAQLIIPANWLKKMAVAARQRQLFLIQKALLVFVNVA